MAGAGHPRVAADAGHPGVMAGAGRPSTTPSAPARGLRGPVLAALALLAAFAAALPARAQPADGRTFLPFFNAPPDGVPINHPPALELVIEGRAHRVEMDTGSTGVVLAARDIPHLDRLPQEGPGTLTYSSSGRIMRGHWVRLRLRIRGADGAEVHTRPMPVLAIDRIECQRTARFCRPSDRPRGVAMMGVGFARQKDHQPQGTPEHNPFLSLARQEVRRGYTVTRHGVWLGVTDAGTAGFSTVKLQRAEGADDWSPAPACLTLNQGPPACGSVLVDTGLTTMYLTIPAPDGGMARHLPDGARIGIGLLPGSGPTYTVTVGDRSDPAAPDAITLVPHGPRPFVNTSVRFLNRFEYLYDADRGLVGYRPLR